MKNSESGITLIALVVTIILLSILAGITITMISDDGGIIKKSQDIADKTNEAQSQEKNDVKDLSGILDDALNPKVVLGKRVPDNTLYASFVAKTDDNKDINVPVPGGYKVVENTQKSNKINDGIVIQDDLGNQFVWIPVPDVNTMYGTDSSGKNWGKLYNFSSTKKSNLNWTETDGVMKISSSTQNREPDILLDTTYGDAASGDNAKGIEQLKNVVGITASPGATNANQSILDNWMNELQNSFDKMIASIKEYKGFYIGRYETGSWSDSDNTNIPKVQKGQTVGIDYINWYQQYAQTKNLVKNEKGKANSNVTIGMIWGCQFDRTIEWIAETNLKEDGQPNYGLLTNSSTWGNYKDSTGDAATNMGSLQPARNK